MKWMQGSHAAPRGPLCASERLHCQFNDRAVQNDGRSENDWLFAANVKDAYFGMSPVPRTQPDGSIEMLPRSRRVKRTIRGTHALALIGWSDCALHNFDCQQVVASGRLRSMTANCLRPEPMHKKLWTKGVPQL